MDEPLSKTFHWLAGEQQREVHRRITDGDPMDLIKYHQGMRNAYRIAAKLAHQAEQRATDAATGGRGE